MACKRSGVQVPYSPSMPCGIVDFAGFFHFQIGRDGLFRILVRRNLRLIYTSSFANNRWE